jgi:hypothetical protein
MIDNFQVVTLSSSNTVRWHTNGTRQIMANPVLALLLLADDDGLA